MTSFVYVDERGFWKPRSKPLQSLKYTLRRFEEMEGKTIVEVGSGLHGAMNGNSAEIWTQSTSAKTIYCLDIDYTTLEKMTQNLKDKRICTHVGNAQSFVSSVGYISIDLLYLDYWFGTLTTGNYLELGAKRSASYLNTYELFRESLSQKSMILIDDTDHVEPWKQSQLIPAAIQDGYELNYVGRQTLLVRG